MDNNQEFIDNLNEQIDYYKKSARQWSEIATQCLSKMTEFSAAGVTPDLMWCFEINERMREARERLLKDMDLI